MTPGCSASWASRSGPQESMTFSSLASLRIRSSRSRSEPITRIESSQASVLDGTTFAIDWAADHHGTIASCDLRPNTHVPALRNSSTLYAIASSPQANRSHRPPSAVSMKPSTVMWMKYLSRPMDRIR
ncbi:hypothetical protein JOD67_001720 [Tenggerimyces flavus]|nr:hypothetical protein [Tenggerimyces flavus]